MALGESGKYLPHLGKNTQSILHSVIEEYEADTQKLRTAATRRDFVVAQAALAGLRTIAKTNTAIEKQQLEAALSLHFKLRREEQAAMVEHIRAKLAEVERRRKLVAKAAAKK